MRGLSKLLAIASAVVLLPSLAIAQGALARGSYGGPVVRDRLWSGNTNVALIDNEHQLYADERRTQLDMRVAKIFRFGKTRVDVGVDGENLLNTNYTTTFDNTYQYTVGNTGLGGTWGNPTAIYTPRYARLNVTLSF